MSESLQEIEGRITLVHKGNNLAGTRAVALPGNQGTSGMPIARKNGSESK